MKKNAFFGILVLVLIFSFFGCEEDISIIYTVNIGTLINSNGSTITADPTSGIEGIEITLTVTPAVGYQLKAGTLKYGTTLINETTLTFNLPAENVIITAEFEIIPETVPNNYQGTYTVYGYFHHSIKTLIPWEELTDPSYNLLKENYPTKIELTSSSLSFISDSFDDYLSSVRMVDDTLYFTLEDAEYELGTFVFDDFHMTFMLDYASEGAYVVFKKEIIKVPDDNNKNKSIKLINLDSKYKRVYWVILSDSIDFEDDESYIAWSPYSTAQVNNNIAIVPLYSYSEGEDTNFNEETGEYLGKYWNGNGEFYVNIILYDGVYLYFYITEDKVEFINIITEISINKFELVDRQGTGN